MAVDETIPRSKSMIVSTRSSTMTEHDKTNEHSNIPLRSTYLLARQHRIERWAYKGRSSSIGGSVTTSSAALGTLSAQKRSESSYSQSGRVLNIQLLQLSEQRQKTIERNNFDQKLFANKQALKHKDNIGVHRTLSYVRKCCKYAEINDDEKENINPAIFLEENAMAIRRRSRSSSVTPPPVKRNLSANARTQTSASMAETFIQHNKKHLGSYGSSPISRKLTGSKTASSTPTVVDRSETPIDDDSQKRHVQFRINTDGTHITSQSAYVISKSNSYNADKQIIRNITSAHPIRSSNSSHDTRISNSAPLIRSILSTNEPSDEEIKESPKPRRSLSRIASAKKSLQEFRLYPERFLSASNRYLPLLRRQALEVKSKQNKDKNEPIKKQRPHFSPPISRLSDGSDLTYEDAKSFLSEENEIGKYPPTSQQQQPAWLEQERKTNKKLRSSYKIDMMATSDDDDDTSERRMAIARLRDREYARLQELIRSNSMQKILEPFSEIKTDEINPMDIEQQKLLNYKRLSIASTTDQSPLKSTKIRELSEILHSIDSLRCSDTIDRRTRRQVDIEKNRAKLGILIF